MNNKNITKKKKSKFIIPDVELQSRAYTVSHKIIYLRVKFEIIAKSFIYTRFQILLQKKRKKQNVLHKKMCLFWKNSKNIREFNSLSFSCLNGRLNLVIANLNKNCR